MNFPSLRILATESQQLPPSPERGEEGERDGFAAESRGGGSSNSSSSRRRRRRSRRPEGSEEGEGEEEYKDEQDEEEEGDREGIGGDYSMPLLPPSPPNGNGLGLHRSNTNPYSKENVTLVLSYFSVGCVWQLIHIPVTVYLIDELGASPAEYTTYVVLTTLPWSLKLPIGLLSDVCPIGGLRRKPYFVLGWILHVLASSILALMGQPGISPVIILSFLSAMGYLTADVMTDAMVVEKTWSSGNNLKLQATGYIARYFGTFVCSLIGALCYNKDDWGWGMTISQFFWLQALIPIVFVTPFFSYLSEHASLFYLSLRDYDGGSILKHRLKEIWELVTKDSVWKPMMFIYVYNVLQVPNAAWLNFCIEGLHFDDFALGVITIFAAMFAWLGLVVYERYFVGANWRTIYYVTTAVGSFFSLLQVGLILGWNQSLHIPDIVFATGDDAAIEFAIALQFLPVVAMYAVMCPPHIAGSAYALLTTFSNVASNVAYVLGDMFTGIWDVSNASLAAGDWTGVLNLAILTGILQLVPITLIYMLPASKEDQEMLKMKSKASVLGGACFLALAVVSILFTIGQSIWIIVT